MFFTLYEGVFRKWFIPSFGSVIVGIKFSLCIIFGVLCLYNLKRIDKKLLGTEKLVFLYILYLFSLVILTPFSGSIIVWGVGILNYLAYILLIIGIPLVLVEQRDLEKFIKFILYTLVISVIIGLVQFTLPDSHWLNAYSKTGDYVAMSGGKVRIVSIFNYITAFGLFLTLTLPIVFIRLLYATNMNSLIGNMLVLLAMLFCIFATGSRTIVIQSLFIIILLTTLFLLIDRNNKNKSVILFLLFSCTTIILFNYQSIGSIESFTDRMSDINRDYDTSFISKSIERVYWTFEPIAQSFQGDILSNLIGRGPGSLNSFFVTDNVSDGDFLVHRDQPLSATIYEIGLVGTILFTFLLIFTVVYQLRQSLKIRNNYYKLLSIGIILSTFQYIFYLSSMSTNWFANFHFWLVNGLVMAIVKLNHIDLKNE